jgi:molybdopterin-guanine dinucleotide biosynthesis protein A
VAPWLAVLAGDRYRDARIAGEANKALLKFGSRTSLERVLGAVEQSRTFSGVIVVGPPELDPVIAVGGVTTPIQRVEQGESLVDNIRRAFTAAGIEGSERLVFATADIPLVKPEELARFAALVEGSQADACIALARPMQSPTHRILLSPYRRSMIIARGGPYLLGNLFALRSRVLEFAEVIVRGRRVRKQSNIGNIARALGVLGLMGVRAGPALVTWLRLVIARALWLRRGDDQRIPAIAPNTDRICAATMALVSGKITVEFMDIGADGACFDIDDVEQYEGMKTIL